MGFFKKKKDVKEEIVQPEEELNSAGWDAISQTFQKLYPGQLDPIHYGVLIPWQLGGNDPLRGISVYEGDDYYHFVSYGLSDLYEKESSDPNYSGYGFELTLKLKKAGLHEDEAEIRCICGILQAVARLSFEQGEIFQPNEYLYTGQQTGIDATQSSSLTGFLTTLDEAGQIDTPNGKVAFVQLIGATDAELQSIINKEKQVEELLTLLGHTFTDYTRASLV